MLATGHYLGVSIRKADTETVQLYKLLNYFRALVGNCQYDKEKFDGKKDVEAVLAPVVTAAKEESVAHEADQHNVPAKVVGQQGAPEAAEYLQVLVQGEDLLVEGCKLSPHSWRPIFNTTDVLLSSDMFHFYQQTAKLFNFKLLFDAKVPSHKKKVKNNARVG